jgi:hypothetical protein
MPRTITHIVIHCADTPAGRSVLPADVDAWHKQRGFQRLLVWRKRFNPDLHAIGYHYLIDVDGQIYTGRHPDEAGAHVQGHNGTSIGICLAGQGSYTIAQWQSLRLLVQSGLKPAPAIVGHRDFPDVTKTCPGFDVSEWIKGGMEPLEGHIYE